MAKKKQATPRERKYVKGRVAGKSKRQAAIEAGYAETTAENANQKLDKKPAVQDLFRELMEKAGITNELLALRIFEGLNATETKFWQPKTLKLTQMPQLEGAAGPVLVPVELISRTLISFSERREMLELALKVKGLLTDKHEHSGKVRLTLEELLEESKG